MDSKERVKTTLNHQEPDRIPLDIGGSRVTGIHIKAYQAFRSFYRLPPSRPEILVFYLQLAKIDEDFRSLLKVDMESINPDSHAEDGNLQTPENGGSYYRDRWNCGWYMPDGGDYYDMKDFPLCQAEKPEDLTGYRLPDPASEKMFRNFTREAGEISQERKRGIILSRDCAGIYEMAAFLLGHEKFMMDLLLNTSMVEVLLERILEYKIRYWQEAINRVLAADVDYFIVTESEDLGSQNGLLISPKLYRDLIKPRHAALFKFIKERSQGKAYIELHSCGAIREIIPDLIESGVEILNPVQVSAARMETASLKKEFGKALVFHGGGIDSQYTLPYGKVSEVRDEVKRRIDDLAPGGGFIFTPVHSIQKGVPPENLAAMLETFYQYAGY